MLDEIKIQLPPVLDEEKSEQLTSPSRLAFFFKMFDSAKEIGRPETAAHYVRKIEEMAGGSMDLVTANRLAAAKEWVAWAIDYERIHGKQSLLDRTHPTHLRALSMLQGKA